MNALGAAVAAIVVLGLLTAWGWILYARARKRNGQLEEENLNLREERNARIAQDASFDSNRGRDMASDAEFLSDS